MEGDFKEYNDVYFKYEYFELYDKYYKASPEGIFWKDENIKIFWTHLIRNIGEFDCFKGSPYLDLITPYGYGGPIIIAKTSNLMKVKSSLSSFFGEYRKYALVRHYVCEFVRFHPVFKNQNFFEGIVKNSHLNDVVEVDLGKELKDIFRVFRKGHRYNIKKAIRDGCSAIIIDCPNDKNISNFTRIYNETMGRNNASEKYYFTERFIKEHFKLLDVFFVEIWYKERILCSSMFLIGSDIAHYYLSGSVADAKKHYPSSLAIWEAIKYTKGRGCRLLQLGGGRGSNDSLFDFKNGFSQKMAPFFVGEIIFDEDAYYSLVKKNNKAKVQTAFFPSYRYGLEKGII